MTRDLLSLNRADHGLRLELLGSHSIIPCNDRPIAFVRYTTETI
jgi:hypothetical protein